MLENGREGRENKNQNADQLTKKNIADAGMKVMSENSWKLRTIELMDNRFTYFQRS